MDYKYIEQLLDRYFAAETTLQEEQILHAFFVENHEDMPEELSQYAPLFIAMQKEETLGDDFDERMLAMTGQSDNQKTTVVKARVVSLSERLRPLFSAAAVVAIFLTLGNAINQSFKNSNTEVDTEEYAGYHVTKSGDPAMAYDQSSIADSLSIGGDMYNQMADSLKSLGID